MTTMEQVEENVSIAARSRPNILTSAELRLLDQVSAAYHGLNPIPCTNCRYCVPCPNGVEIPQILTLYNDVFVYDDLEPSKLRYNAGISITKEQRADNCLECLECVKKCPQGISVPEWLKKAHALLNATE